MRSGVVRSMISGATLFGLLTPMFASQANGDDQYWHREIPNLSQSNAADYASGWRKLAIDDSFNGSATSSIFAAWPRGIDVNYEKCDSVDSGPCLDPTLSFIQGESILTVCSTVVTENCVEGLSVSYGGSTSPAVFLRSLDGFTFPANELAGTPAGGTVSIWDSAAFPHTGGPSYAVSAQIDWFRSSGRTSFSKVNIRVAAIAERPEIGARVTVPYTVESGTPGGNRLQGRAANHYPGKNGCFFTQDQVCAYEQEYAPATRLKLSLRVSNRVTGWLYGRLKDPNIAIRDLGNGQNQVEIEAEPVRVPKLHTRWNVANFPGVIDDSRGRGAFGDGNLMAGSTDSDAFEIIQKLRTNVSDSATGHKTYWALASTPGQDRCINDRAGLSGIVTTNAMVFSGGPPVFANGYLGYRVAGMHHEPDGVKVELGTYDVLIRSDVARCLYGYSNAPISATVQVVGAGLEEKVASTLVTERDGWLKLSAYGFTFSEKQIQVRISQPQTRSTSRFLATSRLLSSRQKQELWEIGPLLVRSKTVTCTVLHSKPSGRALAVARAKVACAFLRPASRDASHITVAKLTSSKNLDGRLDIGFN